MRDIGYLAFLRDKPCVVCERPWCDAAHTVNNGMSSKGADSSCVPLCRAHHQEYDSGRQRFEEKYQLDMREVSASWYRIYALEANRLSGGLQTRPW